MTLFLKLMIIATVVFGMLVLFTRAYYRGNPLEASMRIFYNKPTKWEYFLTFYFVGLCILWLICLVDVLF